RELARDGVRHSLRIASHQDYFDMLFVQALNRFSRFIANGVGDGEDGQRRSSLNHGYRGLPARSRAIDGSLESRSNLDVQLTKQGRTAEQQLAPVHDGLHAQAWNGLEALGRRERQPPFLRTLDDALRDGVLRIMFDRRREDERLIGAEALCRRD